MAWHGRARRVAGLMILAGLLGLSGAGGRAQTGSPALTLHLMTNQAILGPGSTLEATVGVTYTGAPQTVDLLFGAILPDGDSVVAFGPGMASSSARVSRLSTVPTFYSGLTLATGVHAMVPDLLRYTFNGIEPLGTYRLFFAAVTPGAFKDDRIDPGDVVAVQFADIVVRPPATVTVDPSRVGAASVGPAGGSVVATGADGTVFTLDVPPGALSHPTTITLTPVTSITGAPGDLHHVMAVRAAPEGLRFTVPAQLRVIPPTAVPSRGWIGIGMSGDGAGFDLTPAGAADGTIVAAVVQHFSVFGVAIPEDVRLIPSGLTGASYLSRSINALGAGDQAGFEAILREWRRVLIEPLLRAGQSDPAALFQGMGEHVMWDVQRVLPSGDDSVLTAEAAASEMLMADGVRVMLARGIGACLAAPSLATAEDVLRLQNLAWQTFQFMRFEHSVPRYIPAPIPVHADLRDLDLATVMPMLCVKAEIVDTTFPGTLQQGVSTPMSVRAGLRFTDGQLTPTPLLQVVIDATGATPAHRTGFTDGAGTFATAFTPTSGNLTFDINVTLVDGMRPYLSLAPLAATTRLTRTTGGVVVTPSQTTIAPGQSRQFTANQSVTWTVNGGGTITNTGMFTSNSTLGTFFVTATSVVNPTEVGVAQVTVGVPVTGELQVRVTATRVTGQATLNGVTRFADRPLAEAQAVVNDLVNYVRPAASLTFLSVVVDAPIALSVNLAGMHVTGSVATGVSRFESGACTVTTPGQPVLQVAVGDVDGGIGGSTCSGAITVSAGNVGTAGTGYVTASSSVQVTALRAARVDVRECRGGQVSMVVPSTQLLQLWDSTDCQFSLQGAVSGGPGQSGINIRNVVNSRLGTIHGGTIPGLVMAFSRDNVGTFQIAGVGGPGQTGNVLDLQGSATQLSSLQLGSVSGGVRLTGNTGFSDSAAHAFLDALGHSGTRTIVGNVP